MCLCFAFNRLLSLASSPTSPQALCVYVLFRKLFVFRVHLYTIMYFIGTNFYFFPSLLASQNLYSPAYLRSGDLSMSKMFFGGVRGATAPCRG